MTYVDERVVELRFDNKQFEQETAKSMSTLDKLKEKLQFKNASAGAEQLQRAVANVNVNPIIQGIGTIETKMSALGIVGKRVIENLVDWGMSGITKIVNKLNPIPQIITGGKNRAQNIEQAKFQLKGLGVAWEDIQEDINYGVKDTAYGLDAAAKVASQLVASQVQLGDDMKHSLLGISGVAAMTNSTYEDIGHIYTTVAGNGRLMGEQLLQLSGRGINAAATLAKALNTTEANVRDMVSKGEISFKMFSEAMWSAFGEHAKSANETFQGALSNTKAALSRLGADVAAAGFNAMRDILNDLIPKLNEFKKGMKPVEDAIITMIDSVGKLIQTFVKSINIEGIVNRVAPVIERAANAIGEFADAYNLIFNEKSIKNTTAFLEEQKGLERLKDSTNEAKDAMLDLTKVSEEEKQMAKDIWEKGTYGNGAERVAALGDHYERVQGYLEKMIELGWDESKMEEYLSKQLEEKKVDDERALRVSKRRAAIENLMAIFNNLKYVVNNVFESIKNVISVAFSAFGKELNSNSLAGGMITFTAKLAELSDKLKINKERAEKLKPIFEILAKVIKLIGRGFIFAVETTSKLITKIGEFYEQLKESERFQRIKENVTNTFEKIKETVIDVYEKLKSKGILTSLMNGLGALVEFISNVLAAGIDSFSYIFSNLIDGLSTGVSGIMDLFSNLFTSITNGLEGPLKSLLGWIGDLIDAISIKRIVQVGGLALLGKFTFDILSLIYNIFGIVRGASEIGHSIVDFFVSLKDLGEAKVRQINVETLLMFMEGMTKIIWAIVALTLVMSLVPNANKMAWQALAIIGIITTLYAAFDIISKKIFQEEKKNGKFDFSVNVNAKKLQTAAMLTGIALMMLAIFKGLNTLYNIVSSENYDPGALLSSLVMMIGIIGLVGGAALGIMYALKKMEKVEGLIPVTLFLLGFARSFKVIMSSLSDIYKTTSKETNMNRFVSIVGIITALYGAILGIVYAVHKMGKVKGLGSLSILLLSYALSIKIITSAVGKIIDSSNNMKDPNAFRKSVESVIAIIGTIGLILVAILGINALSNKRIKASSFIGLSATILSLAALLKSIQPSIESISKIYDKYGAEKASDSLWGLVRVIGVLGLMVIAIQGLSSKSRVSSTLPLVGLSVVILTLSHTIKTLGKVIKQLSDVPTAKISDIATILGVLTGVLAALMVVIAKFVGPTGALGLLAFSVLAITVGAALYLAAKGFETFTNSITDFVNSLPTMLGSLLSFFKTLSENKQTLIDGMYDLAYTLMVGAIQGIVAGFDVFAEYVPDMINGIVDSVIAAISGAADAIITKGPKLAAALRQLKYATMFAIGSALFGKSDPEEMSATDFFLTLGKAEVSESIKNMLTPQGDMERGWGENFGSTTTTTTTAALEDVKKEAEKAGKEVAKTYHGNFNASYEEERYKQQQSLKKENTNSSIVDDLLDETGVTKAANSKVGKWIQNKLGISVDEGKETVKEFTSGITTSLNSIKFEDIAGQKWEEISSKTGITYGSNYTNGFLDAIQTGDPEIVSEYTSMFNDIEEISLDSADDMTAYGNLGFTNYEEGVRQKKEAVENASKEVQDAAIDAMLAYEPEYYKVGQNLTWALALGIVDGDMKKMTITNISDVVRGLELKAQEVAQINSPSKVFYKIGEFITLGMANGILDMSKAAENSTEEVAENSMSALEMILNKIFDTTMAGMDTSPVITPVLDLSQLQEGLYSMSGMLDNNSSFGLAFGAANGYNSVLAARNRALNVNTPYDGTNVVNAISELRSDISSLKDAMGTMGFYVDGRQMATAIADPMNKALNDISVQTGRGVR